MPSRNKRKYFTLSCPQNQKTDNDTNLIRPLARTTLVSQHQKGKTNRNLLKQQRVSGSGISWSICNSVPHCRQITMPAPTTYFITGQMPLLAHNQQHQITEGRQVTQKICIQPIYFTVTFSQQWNYRSIKLKQFYDFIHYTIHVMVTIVDAVDKFCLLSFCEANSDFEMLELADAGALVTGATLNILA